MQEGAGRPRAGGLDGHTENRGKEARPKRLGGPTYLLGPRTLENKFQTDPLD